MVPDEHDDDRCPRKAWQEDLCKEIKKWKEDGDQIILFADINQNVRSPAIVEAFAEVQMRDLLAERHGPHMPFTHFDGSEPVDGVWATPGITVEQGGMLPFGEGTPGSDHRMTWIDISCHTAFGNIPPEAVPAPAQ